MYQHILIATDGSELAARGLDHGFALAGALKAKVTVLTVLPPLDARAVTAAIQGGIHDPVMRYDQNIDAEMEHRFAPIRKRAAEAGIEVELVHEIDESPAEAIGRMATTEGCDLIVMSSHGRRGAQRLILGSQTSEVLVHTKIPVLVIR